jgi:hypothetical protein
MGSERSCVRARRCKESTVARSVKREGYISIRQSTRIQTYACVLEDPWSSPSRLALLRFLVEPILLFLFQTLLLLSFFLLHHLSKRQHTIRERALESEYVHSVASREKEEKEEEGKEGGKELTSMSSGKFRIAQTPVSWFSSAKESNDRKSQHLESKREEGERREDVRCPLSCMLEKINASPPRSRTSSTSAT